MMQYLALLQQLDKNVAALRSLAISLAAPESERARAHTALAILLEVKKQLRAGAEEVDVTPWGYDAQEALAPSAPLLQSYGVRVRYASESLLQAGPPLETDCTPLQKGFPHVWQQIEALWGRPPFRDFISKMLTGTLEDSPVGFPPEIVALLFKLQTEHDRRFPEKRSRYAAVQEDDMWDIE